MIGLLFAKVSGPLVAALILLLVSLALWVEALRGDRDALKEALRISKLSEASCEASYLNSLEHMERSNEVDSVPDLGLDGLVRPEWMRPSED